MQKSGFGSELIRLGHKGKKIRNDETTGFKPYTSTGDKQRLTYNMKYLNMELQRGKEHNLITQNRAQRSKTKASN